MISESDGSKLHFSQRVPFAASNLNHFRSYPSILIHSAELYVYTLRKLLR